VVCARPIEVGAFNAPSTPGPIHIWLSRPGVWSRQAACPMVRGEEWTRWAVEVVLRPSWLLEALCRPHRGAPVYLPPTVTS
jgi:hypothetical protein